jgi:hypothetical protein
VIRGKKRSKMDSNPMEKKEVSSEIIKRRKKLLLNREEIKSFLIRHHPKCEKFNGHTIKIGRNDFCIGCFIGYPTAFLGILIIYLLSLVITFRSGFLLLVSTFLLSSFILSLLHLTNKKNIKIIQKFFIGLGFAFLFWGIWTLPNSFILNLFLFVIIFGILYSLIMSYHAYSFYITCKKCEYSRNWEECPGFKDL